MCLSPLVILEVEDITRKCTFGHIKKKGGYNVLIYFAMFFDLLNKVNRITRQTDINIPDHPRSERVIVA
jgi:hypothetical protein